MKKISIIIIALIAAALFWFLTQGQPADPSTQANRDTDKPSSSEQQPADPKPPGAQEGPAKTGNTTEEHTETKYDDLSAQFMVDYGKEGLPPQNDVIKVAGILESYFLLVKSKESLSVGENREVSAALTGENPYRIRFLSPDSPWLNAQGELTDRWNTPLYFHAVSPDKVGVRSAGPDQKMWTPDDLIDGPNALPLSESE